MGEVYEWHQEEVNGGLNQDLQTVEQIALAEVEQWYGSGYPRFIGGENGGLAYHNVHHTQYVIRSSERMVYTLGLGQAACLAAKVAAAAHDIVQLKPRGIMEEESAVWLEVQASARNIPLSIIRAARLAILGTEPIIEGGKITGQMATAMVYPDRATEFVARSVASADLAELYDPFGPYHGHRLWQEINGKAPVDEFPMEDIVTFQEKQVELVRHYTFPHPAAEALFGTLRSPVIKHQEHILCELEAGNISSGKELLAADIAFAKRYA